ncbi:MAG: hypothetical protein HZY79_10095 [Rhodoblastus sp.]|nr:MAG: hypothetical protein HZY79_10095 [Rhodoblastus sp.]
MSDRPPGAPETEAPDQGDVARSDRLAARARSRRSNLLAGVLAALAVGGVLWWQDVFIRRHAAPDPLPTGPAEMAPPPGEQAEARKLIDQRLAAAKDYAPFLDLLAQRFPADSAQIRDGFATRAIADKGAATPDRFVADALKNLRETRGVLAAKADAPLMSRVFEAQGAMLAALRDADAKLCVDFVYGGATDAFMAFSASHRALLAGVAQASLDAILDGADKRIERDAPTDEDFALLEKALRDKGMGDAEVATLLDGKTADPPLADERMCDAARAYVTAVLGMPEPARSRVLALAIELMARS